MKVRYWAITFLMVLTVGCVSKQNYQSVVYSRTKDIRLSGKITAQKGEPMLSVTWKYAKQGIDPDTTNTNVEVQDCFKSELVYNGVSKDAIRFLVKNYICGTYSPVSVETMSFAPALPLKVTFHSMHLKILAADHASLVFEDIL